MSHPLPPPASGATGRSAFVAAGAVLGVMGITLLVLSGLPGAFVDNEGGEGDLTLVKFAVGDAATGVLVAMGCALVAGALASVVAGLLLGRVSRDRGLGG